MSDGKKSDLKGASGPWNEPGYLLGGAVLAAGGALGIRLLAERLAGSGGSLEAWLWGLRIALLGGGLLAAARSVVLQPRSSFVLGLAACASALGCSAIEVEYDSFRLVLAVATALAAVAAVLALLPRVVNRVIVSLLLVFHFGGILTAVTSIPPPGAPALWLNTQLWTRCYRPYLQFAYLTNAYHFYAPEPGPATLLWFCIHYADGSSRWVKLPDRRNVDPLLLEYYRQLSLTENVNQNAPSLAPAADAVQRRRLAGQLDSIPSPEEISRSLPGTIQYRVPAGNCQRLLRCYAQHIAQAYPGPADGPADPGTAPTVRGIKIYRVSHVILHPAQLARGMDPVDPTSFLPYYMGEFDSRGNPKDPRNPYLYWLIPVLPQHNSDAAEADAFRYLRLHAGSSPWQEKP
jgi:hypothetical protein